MNNLIFLGSLVLVGLLFSAVSGMGSMVITIDIVMVIIKTAMITVMMDIPPHITGVIVMDIGVDPGTDLIRGGKKAEVLNSC